MTDTLLDKAEEFNILCAECGEHPVRTVVRDVAAGLLGLCTRCQYARAVANTLAAANEGMCDDCQRTNPDNLWEGDNCPGPALSPDGDDMSTVCQCGCHDWTAWRLAEGIQL